MALANPPRWDSVNSKDANDQELSMLAAQRHAMSQAGFA
jgi:hypothetical protein